MSSLRSGAFYPVKCYLVFLCLISSLFFLCSTGMGRMDARQWEQAGDRTVGFTLWNLTNTVKKWFSSVYTASANLCPFKIFSSGRSVTCDMQARNAFVYKFVFMQINTNDVFLQVELILCQNIRKGPCFMANLYNGCPGLCGALSTTFGLLIGKIANKITKHIEMWFDSNAKEAFVFAQVSPYFPTSRCLMSVLLLLKATKNLRAAKANLQWLDLWSFRVSNADSLLSFCCSHMLCLTFFCWWKRMIDLWEEKRSRKAFYFYNLLHSICTHCISLDG